MDISLNSSLPYSSISLSNSNLSSSCSNLACDKSTFPYKHIRVTKNISGFVVNMHDPTNFDIDLDLTPALKTKYENVITSTYTFHDFTTPLITTNDILGITNVSTGTAYRCRLRGISINKNANHGHSSEIYNLVKNLIDKNDCWITCSISDIDIYRRILVDITFIIDDTMIDLKDFILAFAKTEAQPSYYPYVPTKYYVQ